MILKFLPNENIKDATKRVAIELLDDSINRLEKVQYTFDDSIHETRKNFKKIRGLLRLVRFELGYDLYKKENILFRDTGRILSGIRDAAVMIESVDFLRKKYPSALPKDQYRILKKNLSLRASRVRAQFKKNKDLLEAIITILTQHKDEIRNWPLHKNSIHQVLPGLNLVYERGQIALRQTNKNPTAENFHDWRKRVKYLLYQIRILEEAWPDYMNILSFKLSDLSDLLGIEHDLAELRSLLISEELIFENKVAQSLFFNLIGQERLSLQAKAKSIAPYVFSESSDNFISRIEAYWIQSSENNKS